MLTAIYITKGWMISRRNLSTHHEVGTHVDDKTTIPPTVTPPTTYLYIYILDGNIELVYHMATSELMLYIH